MTEAALSELLPPKIAAALEKRGFEALTPVQHAVLEPRATGRDLRITSQTGSGKTVAIGLVLAELAEPSAEGPAGPRCIVITPTRELAKQVEDELRWLYATLGARVASLTGGASYRDELRALAAAPPVIVGTPGRLFDHLERGSLDASHVGAVVLDEADRMLDMGFRDDIEAILAKLPDEHRTHLVSATFPRDVEALAGRVQKDALHVEGTKLGAANADIDHVVHIVDPAQRFDALVNVLLARPGDKALVFAETRAEVGEIATELARAGFGAAAISGDLEQRERTRALGRFRAGDVRVLVATDVAARGIDVEDIALVVQMDPPLDPDAYTHRSGRTGRAGKRGTSALLVTPRAFASAKRTLDRAKVALRVEPIPTAESIRRANDDRLFEELVRADEAPAEPRIDALAERLVAAGSPARLVAKLLAKAGMGAEAEAREVRVLAPPAPRSRPGEARANARQKRFETSRAYPSRPPDAPPLTGPRRADRDAGGFTPFVVTWGALHGADPRRMLAMICRRGGIQSADVGAIDVGRTSSTVQISESVAARFAEATSGRDPRDPKVRVTRADQAPEHERRPAAPRPQPPSADDRGHRERPSRGAPRPLGRTDERSRPSKPRANAADDRVRPSRTRSNASDDRPTHARPRSNATDDRHPAHARPKHGGLTRPKRPRG